MAVSKEDMLDMVVPVKSGIRTLKLAPFSFAGKNSRHVKKKLLPRKERILRTLQRNVGDMK